MESHTVEMAFETEVSKMRLIHNEHTAADALYLKNKREEMESFKDAEKQEIPAAERLEEFARIEVSRSIDELDKFSLEMDAMRLEYREMKRDYEEVFSEMQRKEAAGTIDKAKQRQCAEMRSMVSVAETRYVNFGPYILCHVIAISTVCTYIFIFGLIVASLVADENYRIYDFKTYNCTSSIQNA